MSDQLTVTPVVLEPAAQAFTEARRSGRSSGRRRDGVRAPALRPSGGVAKDCGSDLGAPTMRRPARSSTIGCMFMQLSADLERATSSGVEVANGGETHVARS